MKSKMWKSVSIKKQRILFILVKTFVRYKISLGIGNIMWTIYIYLTVSKACSKKILGCG
jgi:hypothetical protein